jgi:O-antigen/teichoic acid export membrane protein
MYNPAMLGFYDRGKQFPQQIISNIDGSIQAVLFPVFSSEQDNKSRVKDMMKRAIVTSSFVVFPAMVGLAVIAEPLVKLLLTDKWLPAVPFLQIFCAIYALSLINTANLSSIKALGHSDIYLRLEIIRKIYGLGILGVTVFYGVYAIALGQVLSVIISTFVNAYPNRKLLNYSYLEQWKDIYPSLLLSLAMGLVVYSIKWLGLPMIMTLTIQVLIGIIIYIAMAWVFKLESFEYLVNTMKGLMNKETNGESL